MFINQPRRRNILPPEYRLRTSFDYKQFFGKSKVLRLPFCIIFRIPNDFGHFRLGITVKARTSSVERNRVKRQIRELFRCAAWILGGFDYNVVIPSGKKLSHIFAKQLRASLERELNERFCEKFR